MAGITLKKDDSIHFLIPGVIESENYDAWCLYEVVYNRKDEDLRKIHTRQFWYNAIGRSKLVTDYVVYQGPLANFVNHGQEWGAGFVNPPPKFNSELSFKAGFIQFLNAKRNLVASLLLIDAGAGDIVQDYLKHVPENNVTYEFWQDWMKFSEFFSKEAEARGLMTCPEGHPLLKYL